MTESFDADRLDAWLEGNPFPSASLNGHSDTQADLVSTVQRFHADMGAAERGVPVPARAIWEDVMQRTADLTISPPVIAATNGNGNSRPPASLRNPVMEPPHRRGYRFATGSLIVIAILAIITVAYLANRPSNGGDEVPGLGISAFTPAVGSSVTATPDADDPAAIPFTILDPTKIDCSEVVRRSNEEITALQANPGEFPERSYGPAVATDPYDARLVSVTDQYFNGCRADWWTLASPRVIHETRQTGSIQTLFPSMYLDQGMTMEEIPAFLQSLVAQVGVTEPEDLVLPIDAFGEEATWAMVINPTHARMFPDGRIGAARSYLVHSNQVEPDPALTLSNFVFYIQDPTQDGKWVLDEILPICVGECDEYWTGMAEGSWYEQSPQPVPGTTPEASPAADNERWLVHPDDLDCLRADTDPLEDEPTVIRSSMPPGDYLPFGDASDQDQLAIATKTQQLLVVCDLGNEPLISDDFSYFDTPYGDPVTQQQLNTVISISEAVETDDLMDYIVVADESRPTNLDGDLYSFSRRTLLPDSIVLLPDGRLGGPLTAIIPSAEDRATIGDYIADRGQIETNFVIFEQQGDTWVLDESITLCLGDCDDWWATYQIANEPALGTPEASPVASPDIDRWLVPPSSVDCGTPVDNDLNSNEWSTDLVIDTDAYLPFSEPPASQQEAIAETALLAFSDCVNSTMLSPDFAWMPGPSVAIPSDEQIAAAKEISNALPDQNPANYLLVVPSDDPDYRGRTVVLPDDVVMLADGRLGAPYRYFATTQGDANWTRSQMGDGTFAMLPFLTFERSGDIWLLDEMFMVCVGECEQAWQAMVDGTNLDGTPEPLTISPASFDAITADDCPPVSTGFAGPFNTPRYDTGENPYVVAGLPGVDILGDVTDSVRSWRGCALAESDQSQHAFQTTAFTENGGTTQDPWFGEIADPAERANRATGFQMTHRDLADAILAGERNDFNVPVPYAPDGYVGLTPMGNRAVVLADARIAVPLMTIWEQSAWASEGGKPYWFVPVDVLIWSTEADRWLVDESFQLCAGDCDQFLFDVNAFGAATPPAASPGATPSLDGQPIALDPEATLVDPGFILPPPDSTYTDDGFMHPQGTPGIESTSVVVLPPVDGAPAPTPERTPQIQMLSANDCTVQGIPVPTPPPPGTSVFVVPPGPASYEVVGSPTADDMATVERDARQWQSCSVWGSDGQRAALQTDKHQWSPPVNPMMTDFEPENRSAIAEGTLTQRAELAEKVLTGDWFDFNVPVEPDSYSYIPQVPIPERALVLADTRIAMPLVTLWSQDTWDSVSAEHSSQPYWFVYVNIFAYDREVERWLIDESIYLCDGDCDQYVADLREQAEDGDSTTTPAASPAASNVPDERYNPITADECTIAGLTSEEVSAIIRDPGEEPDRSYVPVGPADAIDAEAAIAADRAWQSCSAYGSIGQRTVLQTPWLTATGPDPDLNWLPSNEIESMVTERQSLSDAMLSDDPFDYLISSGQTQEEMIANLTAPSFTIPASGGAFKLEDGRIAIPQIEVLAEDSYQFTDDWSPTFNYVIVPIHFMAQDPATGGWLVDEVTWICAGDCDQLIVNVQSYEDAILEQSGQAPATPEATPAAGS